MKEDIFNVYYSLIDQNNQIISEASKEETLLKTTYKFKFTKLKGADLLSETGSAALDRIKDIIDSSDQGSLNDLINLKIDKQLLQAIENDYLNVDEDEKPEDTENTEDDAKDDAKDGDDSEKTDDLAEDDETNDNKEDDLAEDGETNNNKEDDLAEDSKDEKKTDNSDLTE